MSLNRSASILLIVSAAALLAGCGMTGRHKADTTASGTHEVVVEGQNNSRFAGMFGRKKARTVAGPEQGIGVNGYLWRASLDTLAFMPLSSADPYGGVIITDWYANPEKPDERFKAQVYILATRLRAAGLAVTVYTQTRAAGGQWTD